MIIIAKSDLTIFKKGHDIGMNVAIDILKNKFAEAVKEIGEDFKLINEGAKRVDVEKYPMEEIQDIVQSHWSQVMTELDDYIDTDCLEIEIKLTYESFDEGFKLEFNQSREE